MGREGKGRIGKGRKGKGSIGWGWEVICGEGCEGCVNVVKWNEGNVKVKYGNISPLHNVFLYCYSLGYSVPVLIFLLLLIY
jgi:hypothetical protein